MSQCPDCETASRQVWMVFTPSRCCRARAAARAWNNPTDEALRKLGLTRPEVIRAGLMDKATERSGR